MELVLNEITDLFKIKQNNPDYKLGYFKDQESMKPKKILYIRIIFLSEQNSYQERAQAGHKPSILLGLIDWKGR